MPISPSSITAVFFIFPSSSLICFSFLRYSVVTRTFYIHNLTRFSSFIYYYYNQLSLFHFTTALNHYVPQSLVILNIFFCGFLPYYTFSQSSSSIPTQLPLYQSCDIIAMSNSYDVGNLMPDASHNTGVSFPIFKRLPFIDVNYHFLNRNFIFLYSSTPLTLR